MKRRLVKKAFKKAANRMRCRIKLKGIKLNKALFIVKTAGMVSNEFKKGLPPNEVALNAVSVAMSRADLMDIISQSKTSLDK